MYRPCVTPPIPSKIERVRRRVFLSLAPALAAQPTRTAVRGILQREPKHALKTPDGKLVTLQGESDALAVLTDPRVIGLDFEAEGAFDGPVFEIAPMHTSPLYIYKAGQRLLVTYWCDVCAIRTYSPGSCWCCQEDTAFDPRDRKDK